MLPLLLWCGTICGLIALTDLSSAAMLFATCLLLMFIGRVPARYLFALFASGGIGWYGGRVAGAAGAKPP